jgi:hypothetical protein
MVLEKPVRVVLAPQPNGWGIAFLNIDFSPILEPPKSEIIVCIDEVSEIFEVNENLKIYSEYLRATSSIELPSQKILMLKGRNQNNK